MSKNKNKPQDVVKNGRAKSTVGSKTSATIGSIVNDVKVDRLPNIIESFRNSRRSIGYDEPTYFGFAIDIHSQAPEAAEIVNPFTGLRANPLFYVPKWLNATSYGQAAVNDGKNFTDLNSSAAEACAMQYLNSFTLSMESNRDEIESGFVTLKTKADSLNPKNKSFTRGYYLSQFIHSLNAIQEKTPWAFKEIDGLTNLWKATYPDNEGKPVEIGITGDETVDLRLTTLAENYRMLCYDSFNGRKILPYNLEKFSMDIYYMDLRLLKHGNGPSIINIPGSSASYDETFVGQVNFGGIAFRCMGCRFDFSNFLENATQVKSSIADSNFQPKFKIIIDRVLPATYFGNKSFGVAAFENDEDSGIMSFGNALGGALNLGPFTGGVERVLTAGRRALTNILGAPQRRLNDALLGLQRQFETGVDNFLEANSPVNSRPYEKKSVETLLNERRNGGTISTDVFPGFDNRKTNPIKQDVFPGVDNRKTSPIKRDEFKGNDVRTTLPINQDVFPGELIQPSGKIANDVFPGDVPIMTAINQRKSGGKINSQNPYKL